MFQRDKGGKRSYFYYALTSYCMSVGRLPVGVVEIFSANIKETGYYGAFKHARGCTRIEMETGGYVAVTEDEYIELKKKVDAG